MNSGGMADGDEVTLQTASSRGRVLNWIGSLFEHTSGRVVRVSVSGRRSALHRGYHTAHIGRYPLALCVLSSMWVHGLSTQTIPAVK